MSAGDGCVRYAPARGSDRGAAQRLERGELFSADSIQQNDSLQFRTASGRLVFGGGGIMPDVFVALDTTQSSVYFSELIQGGHVNNFAFKYINANRAALKAQYPMLRVIGHRQNSGHRQRYQEEAYRERHQAFRQAHPRAFRQT